MLRDRIRALRERRGNAVVTAKAAATNAATPGGRPDAHDARQGPQQPARDARAAWTAGRLAVRCTPQWAAWVGRLSTHCQCPAATLIAVALDRYAAGVDFTEPSPPRLDRPGLDRNRGVTRS